MIPLLDLPGPEFLKIYGGLAFVGFVATCVWAALLKQTVKPVRTLPVSERPTVYEIAFAAGGARRAVAAAFEKLLRDGRLVRTGDKLSVIPGFAEPPADWYERAVLKILEIGGTRGVGEALADVSARLGDRIEALGLVVGDYRAFEGGMRASIPAALVLVIGAIKVGIGIHRDKPVAFLLLIMFILIVFTLVVMIGYVSRLRRLRIKPGSSAAREVISSVDSPDASLSVALLGTGVMSAGALASFRYLYPNRNNSSGCTGGCGAGGGGCGGGGGGGDGGGGGCGGCGGGH